MVPVRDCLRTCMCYECSAIRCFGSNVAVRRVRLASRLPVVSYVDHVKPVWILNIPYHHFLWIFPLDCAVCKETAFPPRYTLHIIRISERPERITNLFRLFIGSEARAKRFELPGIGPDFVCSYELYQISLVGTSAQASPVLLVLKRKLSICMILPAAITE